MIKIIKEDLRDTLKGFIDIANNSIMSSIDLYKEFIQLYESLVDNNEKLKTICDKKEFKDNKYFKDIYPIASKLYNGSNGCLKQINNILTKAEKNMEQEVENPEGNN